MFSTFCFAFIFPQTFKVWKWFTQSYLSNEARLDTTNFPIAFSFRRENQNLLGLNFDFLNLEIFSFRSSERTKVKPIRVYFFKFFFPFLIDCLVTIIYRWKDNFEHHTVYFRRGNIISKSVISKIARKKVTARSASIHD